jgi:hypothetical protein
MRKGIGFGELHRLVNLQTVLQDTEESSRKIEAGLDRLIEEDERSVLVSRVASLSFREPSSDPPLVRTTDTLDLGGGSSNTGCQGGGEGAADRNAFESDLSSSQ